MHIEEYLDIIKIKNLKSVNPSYGDIYTEFLNDKTLDAVTYSVKLEFETRDKCLHIENNFHDVIFNIKCNNDISLKVNDVIKPINSHILQNGNIHTEFCVDKSTVEKITLEFTGCFFSNTVKHEFKYYIKNNIIHA
jgi:hypothetical protein